MSDRAAKTCCMCPRERDRPGQAVCRLCHAEYMRRARRWQTQVTAHSEAELECDRAWARLDPDAKQLVLMLVAAESSADGGSRKR